VQRGRGENRVAGWGGYGLKIDGIKELNMTTQPLQTSRRARHNPATFLSESRFTGL